MDRNWRDKDGNIHWDVEWCGTGADGRRIAEKEGGKIVHRIEHCDCGACDPDDAWGVVKE